MPYTIRHRPDLGDKHQWVVTKRWSTKAIGTHPTRERAKAQIAAIYLREHPHP